MKIALISPNPAHLQQMAATLGGQSHEIVTAEGGKGRMRDLADELRPDLVVVDGMCCDPQELAHVEHVTTHHPNTAVILLCATHTPDFLLQSMRAGVREILPSPPPPEALAQAVERLAGKLAGGRQRRGRTVAFVSCKGGSGATFLATNFAWQLAQEGSVLLVDLNLQFGDVLSFVHDGPPGSTIADAARDLGRLDASLLAACTINVAPNYAVLAAPERLADAMEVRPDAVEAILALARTQYDFVVLDTGRMLDTVTIQALDRAERIYAVLQAALPDLRNAGKLLEAFASLGYPPDRIELVVNRQQRGDAITLDQVRKALGAARVTAVGNSFREVNASINHGDPLARTARSSSVVRQLAAMAATLLPEPQPAPGVFGRLFRRA